MSNEQTKLPLLGRRIANRIGLPFGLNPFPRAFPNPLAELPGHASEVFDEVYRHNYWGSEQSRSGVGSEIAFTARYRTGLEDVINSWGFSRIFDAPCGDLNWITPLASNGGIDYVGGDISALVIEDARSRHPTLDLRVFDITKDPFPEADFWHCRDCLFHLPFESIRQALANFSASTITKATSSFSEDNFLNFGFIIRQFPHHDAENCTTTF